VNMGGQPYAPASATCTGPLLLHILSIYKHAWLAAAPCLPCCPQAWPRLPTCLESLWGASWGMPCAQVGPGACCAGITGAQLACLAAAVRHGRAAAVSHAAAIMSLHPALLHLNAAAPPRAKTPTTHTPALPLTLPLTLPLPSPLPAAATAAGAAVLGGKHLAEHIDERMVAYL
jgi:hypothetical protein